MGARAGRRAGESASVGPGGGACFCSTFPQKSLSPLSMACNVSIAETSSVSVVDT